MKLIDKIYKTITFLCALVLFGACDNDKWAEVELDSTPVYELTYLKNVETGKTGEVSKFSVIANCSTSLPGRMTIRLENE